MKHVTTKKMTTLALLTAMAVVVSLLFRVPLVPAVSFLSFDGKDVVLGLTGFLFGPMSAAVVSMISSAIELLFRGGNGIDWLMDVLSSCTFVCTAAFIYKRMHSKNGAFIGLMTGSLCNIVVMLIWNYIMDPIYFGMPRQAVVAMLPAIALFNFLKESINSVILLLIYKPVSNALHQAGVLDERKASVPSGKKSLAVAGTLVLVSLVVFILCLIYGM